MASPHTSTQQDSFTPTPSLSQWSSDPDESATSSSGEKGSPSTWVSSPSGSPCPEDVDCPSPFGRDGSEDGVKCAVDLERRQGIQQCPMASPHASTQQDSFTPRPSLSQWSSDPDESATSSSGEKGSPSPWVSSPSGSPCPEDVDCPSPFGRDGSEDGVKCALDLEKGQHELQDNGEVDGSSDQCRVCHSSVQTTTMSGDVIHLGCDCKDSLALAHRRCAEAWFKIKGNRVCEICGSIANNIAGVEDATFMDHWNDVDTTMPTSNQQGRCWQNQSIFNSLLACLLLALILLWLFRVTLF